jgi:hypothetical protein
MKTITKTSIGLPMAAMLLALAFGGRSTAQAQVPFSASVQGQEKDDVQGNPPQQILVDGSLTGVATQLGLITMTYKVTVNLNPMAGPVGTSTGSAQLIAANGDVISTTVVGSPGLNSIVEINTITGGTGRFAGATGRFILKRLVDLTTGQSSGSFDGTITSPGAAH